MIDLNDVLLYKLFEPQNKERTRKRLAIMSSLGMEDVEVYNFGIRGVCSGLYIERVWSMTDTEFGEYIHFVVEMKLKNEHGLKEAN